MKKEGALTCHFYISHFLNPPRHQDFEFRNPSTLQLSPSFRQGCLDFYLGPVSKQTLYLGCSLPSMHGEMCGCTLLYPTLPGRQEKTPPPPLLAGISGTREGRIRVLYGLRGLRRMRVKRERKRESEGKKVRRLFFPPPRSVWWGKRITKLETQRQSFHVGYGMVQRFYVCFASWRIVSTRIVDAEVWVGGWVWT